MRNSNALRTLVCALLALVAALVAPTAAGASSTQMSLLQDDSELLGDRGEDPAAAMREIRALGVEVIRTNVLFYRVYRDLSHRRKPAGFDTGDPNEPLYNWAPTDRIVDLARQNGIKVLFTVSGPGPHWASEQVSRCRGRHYCTLRPDPDEFGAFVAAVAKRYRGRVDWYALYNEPNLKEWIRPEVTGTRFGTVQTAAVIYRRLWTAGYRSIARFDPARRTRVLFGEVAAISSPLPFLYASLCLDEDGRPFRGALRRLHKCSARPARLPIGGYAIHPYNQGGFGPPNRRTTSTTALPQQYLPRLHRLMARAAGRGRVPGGRGVYITEFGYQTCPPDCGVSRITLPQHARYINESDRLFFGDPRIRTVAQYQLVDVPEADQYNSGLRFSRARNFQRKPAYDAYRLPLVVTRRSARRVEVWGQVRPSVLPGVSAQVTIQMSTGGGFRSVGTATGNVRGLFRRNISRAGAGSASWRLVWQDPSTGAPRTSRVARPGVPLRYYRD